MLVESAAKTYLVYLKSNTRPNTIRSFKFTLDKFKELFTSREMSSITEADIIEFISEITQDCAPSTKNGRVGILRAFFNFIIEVANENFPNPCLRPMVRKLFKASRLSSPKLIEKELIDEIIFRTTNERDRLILELMGRAGMRIGEVLNIHVADINFDNSTVLITEPKSGRRGEKVYLTKRLCTKLRAYIDRVCKERSRVFNISYSTAYRMVRKSGKVVNAFLRPHDLRRHAATQASRNGAPLEVVSKVILRHADISTTQRYLGAIDQEEASRWIEHLHR